MSTIKRFTSGFRFYQKIGGNEHWELLRDDLAKWDEISPTFMSVLKLDKPLRSDSTPQQWAEVKYAGPLYFDFDDADNPVAAVKGAIQLLKLLSDDDISPEAVNIFLSGGKGVHVVVPVWNFIDGQKERQAEPFESNLPHVYKEIAFKYATDCMDFRVYSAKSGRMWRTHYNKRESGLYKVQVTYDELCGITSADDYKLLCAEPRPLIEPVFKEKTISSRLNSIYSESLEAIADKVKSKAKLKSAKDNHPTIKQVKVDKESFDFVSANNGLRGDKGWNHIAMQLCLYARHYSVPEQALIDKVDFLLRSHQSDSYRYNTPKKREREIRRMYDYIADNPTYEYQYGGLVHLLDAPPPSAEKSSEDDNELFDPSLEVSNVSICADTEQGRKAIANFGMSNCRSLLDVSTDGEVYAAAFDLSTRSSAVSVDIDPQDFTGSARLQTKLARLGGVFVGSDSQARALLHIVSTLGQGKAYVLDKSGLNLVRFSQANVPNAKRFYPVWMDDHLIVASPDAETVGLRFEHRPNMTEVHTDLSRAENWKSLLARTGGRDQVLRFFRSLFGSRRPETMGRLLGWYVSCFYKQLFQVAVGSFPLLHVYGVAGAGKTETQRLLLRMFSVDEPPTETSPGTSIFAIVRMLSSSASIPVLLDEWKPSEYKEAQIGDIRGIMREAYNQKPWVRAGAQSKRDTWSGLSKFFLSAPLIYVGEAAEPQTAIVERSVMVGFTRASDQEQAASYRAFLACAADHDVLPSLGRYIAGEILQMADMSVFSAEFASVRDRALQNNTLSVEDFEAHKRGELSDAEYQHKSMTKIRTMLGACTVEYGLRKLQQILIDADLGPDTEGLLNYLDKAAETLYQHDMSSELAVPEYVKVLTSLSDLAKMGDDAPQLQIKPDVDFRLSEREGRSILRLVLKPVWMRYARYLRELGLKPLFSEAATFGAALRNTHHFIAIGKDPVSTLEFIDLDYTSLLRAGCGEFPTKKLRSGMTQD